jgi:hypothetical protein
MLLSLRAYAKRKGVTLSTVQRAIKAGRVTTTPDGKIDPDIADEQWKERTNPAKARPKRSPKAVRGQREAEPDAGAEPEASPDDYWKSRAAREFWEARLSKLKAEREAGNLIPREDAERAWGGMIAAARSKVLALPANLAQKLAIESDLITCEEILKDAAHRILSELSEYQPS